MSTMQELSVEQLHFTCDEKLLAFETTEQVPPLNVMIGQERAVKAVEFGLFTKSSGYNIFMSGLVGTGKITYAKDAVGKAACSQPSPNDWCYVNNFENTSQPVALSLPKGAGGVFSKDMQDLLEDVKTGIVKAFSGEDYERARAELAKGFQQERNTFLEAFNAQAEQLGIMPQWSTTGFSGVPIVDGKPITAEEFQKLDKENREVLEQRMMTVQEKAMEFIRRMQQLERAVREELKGLDGKVGLYTIGSLFDNMQAKYQDNPCVIKYLEAVKDDIVKNINDFKPSTGEEEANPFMMFKKNMQDAVKEKYKVNLLVDNSQMTGAPVIVEINPTYYNLVGRAEYETRMGVVSTDYTMIKAGALHRANGGYLILNIRDVLANVGAWEALKRVLRTRKLYIENLSEQYGMMAMASLKPQPIPIDVKIVLIGNPMLYHLLYQHDEDFRKLFKIHADFDTRMDNNTANVEKLTGFISSTVKREELKHFDRSAVSKVIEYSTRLGGSQKKLTTRFNEIVELLCEADAWATLDGSQLVTAKHIKQAIDEKRYRSNKYEESLQEMYADGKFLIDTESAKVGQVNGLAVMGIGDYSFGKPSRITANTYLGKSGVVNIERETKMSGQSHSKGVLILAGYLGQKYAQKQPLTLTASLTFEQLYDGVDGDSASSTELYAILSSLSDIPLKQYIAVTGSVNQKGEVQPIGGATEKIEGFFSVCKLKGLNGSQGVMIPHQNIDNLMLNDEVVEAVAQGQFHIYPVKTIDEGIEILTGVPAQQVHERVSEKLKEYTETLIKLGKSAEGDHK